MAQELNQNEIRTLLKEVLKYGDAALINCTEVHKIQLSNHVNKEIKYFVNGSEQMAEYAKNNFSFYDKHIHNSEHYQSMFKSLDDAKKVKQILESNTKSQSKQDLHEKLKTDTKQMPKLNEALISFSSNDTLDKVYEALKGYFKGNEAKFRMALECKKLDIHLLFPSNQNKFVEVFLRLKYSGFLLSKPKEIKEWLCSNFAFQYHRGDIKEVRKFNPSTVNDILTKEKGLPSKRERIKIDWLPNMKY